MSRSGYSTDIDDNWQLIKWRGMVASAIRGRRGQRFLREMRDTLDAMPNKELVRAEDYEIVREDGSCCALGAVALARQWEGVTGIDASDHEWLGDEFDIASCLVQEIEFENDECGRYSETPSERWGRMRTWASRLIEEGEDAK